MRIATIDLNFNYIKLNNFPQDVINKINFYYNHYNVINGPDKKSEHLIANYVDSYSNKISYSFFIKELVNICGIDYHITFIVSKPNIGMGKVHADRSRTLSLNIPIKVDHNKSRVLVCNSDNLEKYGKVSIEYEKGIEGKFWHDAKEEDFDHVILDKPILLNVTKPHTWTSYSDEQRVIASLTPIGTLEEVYTSLYISKCFV